MLVTFSAWKTDHQHPKSATYISKLSTIQIVSTIDIAQNSRFCHQQYIFLGEIFLNYMQILIIITVLIHSKFFLYEFSAPEIFFELLPNCKVRSVA